MIGNRQFTDENIIKRYNLKGKQAEDVRNGIAHNHTKHFYQEVAIESRIRVKEKAKKSSMMRNIHYRNRFCNMKGFCADVTEEVIKLLAQKGVFAQKRWVNYANEGFVNHIVAYVPKDDMIIDGTIDQYIPKNYNYVYKTNKYPLRLR